MTERSVMELSEELKTQNLSVQEDLRDAVMESPWLRRTDRRHPGSGAYPRRPFCCAWPMWLQFEGEVQVALKTLQRADEVLQAVQNSLKQDEYDLLPCARRSHRKSWHCSK